MNAYEYILSKQIEWAKNQGIPLQGSKGERGRPAYTKTLEQNLFERLDSKVRMRFEQADGRELHGNDDSPAKMQALHSSSALGVNIFHYWQRIGQIPAIAAACGFCRKGHLISKEIVFEDKYRIDDDRKRFPYPPNIDVVIHNSDESKVKRFAIECKFSEAYTSRKHSGLKQAYLDLDDIWQGIRNLRKLSESLCQEDTKFSYLDPAQLIKHILGLKSKCEKDGLRKDEFRLLYLWYDVLGEEGAIHRKEIEAFSKIARADEINFHSLSYQELILRLSSEYRSGHEKYIEYISGRYL